jgi:hypothetical protein
MLCPLLTVLDVHQAMTDISGVTPGLADGDPPSAGHSA